MSAVLGKIHYWLYNQIQIIDNRNQWLIKEVTADQPGLLKEELSDLIDEHEGFIQQTPLKEALDGQHIHPGLEQLIIKTQSMETAIVELLINASVVTTEALETLYYSHGKALATQKHLTASSLEETVSVLNDVFLERMPCDRLTERTVGEKRADIRRDQKLHTEFWKNSSVELETMHGFYAAWIRGVLEVVNPQITYERILNNDHYVDRLRLAD